MPLKYGEYPKGSGPSPGSMEYKPPLPYSQRNLEPRFPPGLEHGQANNGPVSPMLSEPFHRLIVKDEEEFIDLSSDPVLSNGTRMEEDGEMKPVPEEEEDMETWWENDSMRDFTFEFDTAPTLPPYASRPSRPWPITK
jgi:hypothetical protein